MRTAAIYDTHGNLPALEAVLDEIRQLDVDQIVIGGDVVPGPQPYETLSLLMDLTIPTVWIHGNGERKVLAFVSGEGDASVPEKHLESMQWVAQQLTEEQIHFLGDLPATTQLAIPGLGDVFFCHATARNDTEIFTRQTPVERVATAFADVTAPIVVCGHTHMQFDRMIGEIRVVNAGSVGMPFGNPGAEWLLLGPKLELRHTSYDLEEAADRIRATAFPLANDFAADNILKQPAAAKMLERFERAAI